MAYHVGVCKTFPQHNCGHGMHVCVGLCLSYSCSSAEEKLNIAEGVLKRIIKTQEQREKDLAAVMHSELITS